MNLSPLSFLNSFNNIRRQYEYLTHSNSLEIQAAASLRTMRPFMRPADRALPAKTGSRTGNTVNILTKIYQYVLKELYFRNIKKKKIDFLKILDHHLPLTMLRIINFLVIVITIIIKIMV